MAMSSDADAASAFLAAETAADEDSGVASRLPSIFLHLLAAWTEGNHAAAAEEAARRIHADYCDVYLPSDPLMRGLDDKGMAGFLNRLYELIFFQVRLVGYDDARQDALVETLLELRKLPPQSLKIWGEDCIVYVNDPVFVTVGEDNWNGNFPNDIFEQDDESAKADYQRKCNEWVNFSAFLARCTAAGIYDRYDDRFKYPSVDIPLALEERLPEGNLRECRLMVAALWILHAARAIYDDLIKVDKEGWNVKKWSLWETKLREIENDAAAGPKLKSILGQTLAEMALISATS